MWSLLLDHNMPIVAEPPSKKQPRLYFAKQIFSRRIWSTTHARWPRNGSRSRREFANLPRSFARCTEQEAQIGACRYVARAHLDEFRGELGVPRQAAHAGVLVVSAASRDGPGKRLAQTFVLELARDSQVRRQVVCADQHHVDAVDCDDLLGVLDRVEAFDLHNHHRRLVETVAGIDGGKAPKLQVRELAREAAC